MDAVESRRGDGIRSAEVAVTRCCELPCGHWKTNSGLLQEQPLLTRLLGQLSSSLPRGFCEHFVIAQSSPSKTYCILPFLVSCILFLFIFLFV